MVADPAVVPAIKETDTIPVASGVVTVETLVPLLKLPKVVEKVTEVPGLTGFPALSVSVAVIVEVLVPSAGMLVGFAANAMEKGAPPLAMKTTYTDCVTPLDVADTRADPVVVPAIRETVTIPVLSGIVTVYV